MRGATGTERCLFMPQRHPVRPSRINQLVHLLLCRGDWRPIVDDMFTLCIVPLKKRTTQLTVASCNVVNS